MEEKKLATASEQTARLQQESQRMEERLRTLRQVMAVEKVQREKAGGQHWRSSQREPLTSTNGKPSQSQKEKQVNSKKNKPVKVRVLTENDTNKKERGVGKPNCGQCDQYSASMECVECVENYCTVCFTKIHQKGALSRHHVRPLSQGMMKETSHSSNVKNMRKPLASIGIGCDVQELEEKGTGAGVTSEGSSGMRNRGGPVGGTLLEGSYDEAASAASFQQALADWRRTRKRMSDREQSTPAVATISDVTCISCGVQATPTTKNAVPEIKFSSKSGSQGSYMEQLMLKRKRVDQHFISRTFQSLSSPSSSQPVLVSNGNSSEDEADSSSSTPVPSIYNVFYTNQDKGDAVVQPITNVDGVFGHYCPSHVNIEELHEITTPVVTIVTQEDDTCRDERRHSAEDGKAVVSMQNESITVKNSPLHVDVEELHKPNAPVATIASQEASIAKDEHTHSIEDRKLIMSVQNEGIKVKKRVQTVSHSKMGKINGKKKIVTKTQRHATSQVIEKSIPTMVPGIEESLRLAWSAKQQPVPSDLSTFFYVCNNHEQAGMTDDPVARESDSGQSSPVPTLLPLVLPTAWIPGSSVSDGQDSSNQAHTNSALLHISHSDLPPPSAPIPNLTLHHSANDSGDESDGTFSPCSTEDDFVDAKEWAAADGSTLEELAWELASATARDEDTEMEEDTGREVWSRMTTEQLAEEFEEYQNRVMDEDDFN